MQKIVTKFAVQHPLAADRANPVRRVDAATIYQHLIREVAPLCDDREFIVLAQLVDRACEASFDQFRATAEEIALGDGVTWKGCGSSVSTVKRAIRGLRRKGIISYAGVRNRTTIYTLPLAWKTSKSGKRFAIMLEVPMA